MRSILSVPGHIEKMHHKASNCNADVIMLDLEDSVPLPEKKAARNQVIKSLNSIDWHNKTITVRINAIDSPFAYKEITDIIENAGKQVESIVIPKVNNSGDIHFVCRMLQGIELNKGYNHKTGIEASIETAQGLNNIKEIARASERLKTLVFGIADYSASIGIKLTSISGHGEMEENIYPGHRWNFVLSRIVMTAKANNILAIDSSYGNFKDIEGLKQASLIACSLGCDGKWVIHPDQIEPVNTVFTPSKFDIERASKVLKAHNKAKEKGLGAVAVDGRMVDQATIRMAKDLLKTFGSDFSTL